MKRTIPILLLLLSSCSSELTIRTDYDPDYKIAALPSYTWLERTNIEAGKNPKYYNELNDQRIKRAVDKALQSRGYRKDDDKADMVLHYHIMIEDKETQVREYESDQYGPYWQRPEGHVHVYQEGTLLLDVMDQHNRLIWRGSASSPLELSYTPQRKTDLIEKAVSRMFRTFPEHRNGSTGPL